MQITHLGNAGLPLQGLIDAKGSDEFKLALDLARGGVRLTPEQLLIYVASTTGFIESCARASDALVDLGKRLKNVSGAKATEQQDA